MLEYIWKAAWPLHPAADPAAEDWVAVKALAVLAGANARAVAEITAQPYLEGERGLSAGAVTHYLRYAQAFLAGFPGPLTDTLWRLSAGQVTGYVLELASTGG